MRFKTAQKLRFWSRPVADELEQAIAKLNFAHHDDLPADVREKLERAQALVAEAANLICEIPRMIEKN